MGLGAYRNDDGKPHVLPVVRQAEKKLLEKGLTYEYLGIVGDPLFIKLALKFVYGDDFHTFENRVAGVQTLSGKSSLAIKQKKFFLKLLTITELIIFIMQFLC